MLPEQPDPLPLGTLMFLFSTQQQGAIQGTTCFMTSRSVTHMSASKSSRVTNNSMLRSPHAGSSAVPVQQRNKGLFPPGSTQTHLLQQGLFVDSLEALEGVDIQQFPRKGMSGLWRVMRIGEAGVLQLKGGTAERGCHTSSVATSIPCILTTATPSAFDTIQCSTASN